MEEQKHKEQLKNIIKAKKQIYIVPDEKDYYFCEKTGSIRRIDIKVAKEYIGDKSLTTKQVKRLARQERKKRIREKKKREK